MPRLELELTIQPGEWTWEHFEAFTDRLADMLPDLEERHAWLSDADLAADMAKGVVTIGASYVEPGNEHAAQVLLDAAKATCGDLVLAWAVLRVTLPSGVMPPDPVDVMVLDWPEGAERNNSATTR